MSIIIAGPSAIGKTTLIDTLFGYLNGDDTQPEYSFDGRFQVQKRKYVRPKTIVHWCTNNRKVENFIEDIDLLNVTHVFFIRRSFIDYSKLFKKRRELWQLTRKGLKENFLRWQSYFADDHKLPFHVLWMNSVKDKSLEEYCNRIIDTIYGIK